MAQPLKHRQSDSVMLQMLDVLNIRLSLMSHVYLTCAITSLHAGDLYIEYEWYNIRLMLRLANQF